MKKLLSLTTMAMIALATPTLSADTTANNTTKKVKQVDYSKMNYLQLNDTFSDLTIKLSRKYLMEMPLVTIAANGKSDAEYIKIKNIFQKYADEWTPFIQEVEKRIEKYDENHENNKRAYNDYKGLLKNIKLKIDSTEAYYVKQYKEALDRQKAMEAY
ncbi:hypothetical protein AVBRAN12640_02415 [Campylobacter sp. RM12640]|uniref:hypothetical protein n=1 Tax=unclassified Campylobacter TaxID=2593542 RepID=UPI0030146FB8|nr:hypothetical protein [Campylobacter sp. RM12640]MBZ7989011.1 hypothetical protein [Campylobacter sp. RM12635]